MTTILKKQSLIFISAVLVLSLVQVACNKPASADPAPAPVAVASCSDGIKNQDEVEVDCGGSSCSPCQIKYPQTGIYGRNVLYNSDTLFLLGQDSMYSFRAIVPVGSTLKVEVNRISGAIYSYGNTIGWAVSPYNNGIQTYEALNPGTCELHFEARPQAMGSTNYTGVTLLKFFENSNTETRRKIIVWH